MLKITCPNSGLIIKNLIELIDPILIPTWWKEIREGCDCEVLIGYLGADFQRLEKPKGGPLEIEIFFVEGG